MSDTRLAELRRLIDRADAAYYTTGEALVDDEAYDRLRAELARLAPDDPRLRRVGAAVRETLLTKRAHRIPMGSQFKAANREEAQFWHENNVVRQVGPQRLHATLKLDGSSVALEYEAGRLVAAVTRGDGFVGEDITANALRFRGVPLALAEADGAPFTCAVRGELVLTVADWRRLDPDLLTNPRNLGSGLARRKDGEHAGHLTFHAFRLFDAAGQPLGGTETAMAARLAALGFTLAPGTTGDFEAVWAWFEQVGRDRPHLPFWIDGVVVAVDDLGLQLALGETDRRPKGQVAFKFPAEAAETAIRDIEISVGRTGAVIPTAKFDPVLLGGTRVTSALLCNWEEIAALDVAVGDRVEVVKRGDIIPKVIEVKHRPPDRRPLPEPDACPVCGGATARRTTVKGEAGAVLYCQNPECEAKTTGRIQRWLTGLNILGIGDEILEKLVTELDVADAADLYTLAPRRAAIAELKIAVKDSFARFGEKRTDRILAEIEARRELTLPEFLGSLGIAGLGARRVEQVLEAAHGEMDTLEAWFAGGLRTRAGAVGLPNAGERIDADLQARRPLIEKLLRAGVRLRPVERAARAADAKSFCLTGTLRQPRGTYEELVRSRGHRWKESVAAGLDYLVAADPASRSTKLEKARKLGVQVISEDEFLRLLGGPD